MKKRFIEDEIEFKNDSLFEIIQSALSLILLAPYKMFHTISMKIIYLKKAQISKVILASLIIGFSIIVLKMGYLIFINKFTLFRGAFPLVVELLGCVVLGGLYLIFGSTQLIAFSSINKTNGSSSGTSNTDTIEVKDFDEVDSPEQSTNLDKNAIRESQIPHTFSWFWGDEQIIIGKRGAIQIEVLIESSVLAKIDCNYCEKENDWINLEDFKVPEDFPII